jgi:hypothetical protein
LRAGEGEQVLLSRLSAGARFYRRIADGGPAPAARRRAHVLSLAAHRPRRITDLSWSKAKAHVRPNAVTTARRLRQSARRALARGDSGRRIVIWRGPGLLDGALARATGKVTRFGQVFDATMDRVSESAILFGILYYYVDRNAGEESLLAFAAIVGSLLVSYVKARGEVLGITIREGMFTRAERVILIGGGSIIDQVRIASGSRFSQLI